MSKQIFTILVLVLVGTVAAFGQRYGHLNLGNLIAIMPETADADSQLVKYNEQLIAEGQAMADSFQVAYQAFVEEVQSGTLPPVKQQEKQTKLQEQQDRILAFEQSISQRLNVRRQELLRPVLEKAEAAIAAVAEANGFEMIFDTSRFNAVLFASDSDNIFELVANELGVVIPEASVDE